MKRFIRGLGILLALFLLTGLFTAAATEEEENSFAWYFEEEGGVLIIEGTGDLPACNEENPSPWVIVKDMVKRVILCDGLSAIPDGLFADYEQLESVVLPESIQAIGEKAFTGCKNLTAVEYTGDEKAIKKTLEKSGSLKDLPLAEANHHQLVVDKINAGMIDLDANTDQAGYTWEEIAAVVEAVTAGSEIPSTGIAADYTETAAVPAAVGDVSAAAAVSAAAPAASTAASTSAGKAVSAAPATGKTDSSVPAATVNSSADKTGGTTKEGTNTAGSSDTKVLSTTIRNGQSKKYGGSFTVNIKNEISGNNIVITETKTYADGTVVVIEDYATDFSEQYFGNTVAQTRKVTTYEPGKTEGTVQNYVWSAVGDDGRQHLVDAEDRTTDKSADDPTWTGKVQGSQDPEESIPEVSYFSETINNGDSIEIITYEQRVTTVSQPRTDTQSNGTQDAATGGETKRGAPEPEETKPEEKPVETKQVQAPAEVKSDPPAPAPAADPAPAPAADPVPPADPAPAPAADPAPPADPAPAADPVTPQEPETPPAETGSEGGE